MRVSRCTHAAAPGPACVCLWPVAASLSTYGERASSSVGTAAACVLLVWVTAAVQLMARADCAFLPGLRVHEGSRFGGGGGVGLAQQGRERGGLVFLSRRRRENPSFSLWVEFFNKPATQVSTWWTNRGEGGTGSGCSFGRFRCGNSKQPKKRGRPERVGRGLIGDETALRVKANSSSSWGMVLGGVFLPIRHLYSARKCCSAAEAGAAVMNETRPYRRPWRGNGGNSDRRRAPRNLPLTSFPPTAKKTGDPVG
ncbi:hypothetical protein MRX96_028148 [Rhipicephalus microplus]